VSVVRIATRGSELALAQAGQLAKRIGRELALETVLVVVKTTGDRIQDVSLAKVGGKGLFVKEIEEALLAGRADLAVHSAKDLPAEIAPGLRLVAFPERVDPRDALVAREAGATLDGLRQGARVGTGSTRRRALLLEVRPDLEVVPLRGNVPTRIAKIEVEDLDAVILACAGLDRLGLGDHISERIATDRMLPAVCQGTLALEAREGDPLAGKLAALDDASASLAVAAERAFLTRLEGDCTVPLAVHAEPVGDDRVRVRGLVAALDGAQVIRAEEIAPVDEAVDAGRRVAEEVLAGGGAEILAALRAAEA